MNRIQIDTVSMPVPCGCNFCAAYEPFFHADRVLEFHVMIYVVTGSIYVTEETDGAETDYEISAGEVLFLKAGSRHYGKKACPKGTTWYYAHFKKEERQDTMACEGDGAADGQDGNAGLHLLLPKKSSGMQGSSMERQFKEFVELSGSKKVRDRWFMSVKLFRLLSELALECVEGQRAEQVETLSGRIGNYLEEHWNEPFQAGALEAHFYLSYKHMAAVFKKEKGVTMQQYHTRVRMEEAGKMLRTTMIPVRTVGERTGYQDMLYFSRCFHQYMGMSPTEYRRRHTSDY